MKNEFRCPWLGKRDIREITDGVRSTYWDRPLPVDPEYIVEFGLRLNIEPVRGLFSEFEIDAYLKFDFTGILVDTDRYLNDRFNNRLRFSLAHELGHFFLHRDFLKDLNLNSFQDWKDFILNTPPKEHKWLEWQANEFAGRLIVPRADLEAQICQAFEELKQENSLLQYLAKDPDLVLSCISPSLCRLFGVTEEVIETRVQREELWPPIVHFPDLL